MISGNIPIGLTALNFCVLWCVLSLYNICFSWSTICNIGFMITILSLSLTAADSAATISLTKKKMITCFNVWQSQNADKLTSLIITLTSRSLIFFFLSYPYRALIHHHYTTIKHTHVILTPSACFSLQYLSTNAEQYNGWVNFLWSPHFSSPMVFVCTQIFWSIWGVLIGQVIV